MNVLPGYPQREALIHKLVTFLAEDLHPLKTSATRELAGALSSDVLSVERFELRFSGVVVQGNKTLDIVLRIQTAPGEEKEFLVEGGFGVPSGRTLTIVEPHPPTAYSGKELGTALSRWVGSRMPIAQQHVQ